MKRLRQLGIWTTVAAIGLLTLLLVFGAFLGNAWARDLPNLLFPLLPDLGPHADGAAYAKALFNSAPLVVFWFLLAAVLLVGFVAFRTLIRRPGLLAMHLGSLLVLAGAMWGSDQGHAVAERLLGARKLPSATMLIQEGETTDALFDARTGRQVGTLPFALRLDDFRIEHYPLPDPAHWDLSVGTLVHRQKALEPWKPGSTFTLPLTDIRVRVLRYLGTSRPVLDDQGNPVAAEPDPDAKGPPAMEVLVMAHGSEERGWLVPREGEDYAELLLAAQSRARGGLRGGDYVMAQSLILERPESAVKDYLSDVVVVRDNLDAARKTIEVNHPLHWGGYHLYQVDYDHKAARYTVLLARSDNGLYVVYGGFILLVAGAFWRFWIAPTLRYLAVRQGGAA